MNVCYIAHASNLTGANRSLLDILSCCKEYGIKPFVIIPSKGPIEYELIKENIPYKVIMYTNNVKGSLIRNILNNMVNRVAIQRIKLLLKEKDIHILHNNSFLISVGMMAAYKLKIPYICHIREFGAEDHNIDFINKEKLYDLAKKSSKIIVISKSVYNKFYKEITKSNINLVYNGVNLSKYTLKQKNILENKVVSILIAGRICKGKGQLEAIKAVEHLASEGYSNIELYVVGEGLKGDIYEAQIREYIKDKKLEKQVKIMPFMNDLKEIRKKCDIGLVCSVNEAFGRVTIETMLASELVIGANTGGTAELIDNNKYGLLYEQGNYKDLADKIKYAINNKDEMNIVVNKSYIYARKKFSIQRTMCEINKIYINIMESVTEEFNG